MYSKLKLLFNVPLAFALAFLIVGAPSAPLAKIVPGSGDTLAFGCGGNYGGDPMAPPEPPDLDCDGIPDRDDPCPSDPSNQCWSRAQVNSCINMVGGPALSGWDSMTCAGWPPLSSGLA